MPTLLESLRCPACKGAIEQTAGRFRCRRCEADCPIVDGIPDLIPGLVDEQIKKMTATVDHAVCHACSHLSLCSRCPGLAHVEGDRWGPSAADCEKSYARTGIVPSGSPQLAGGKFRYWKEEGICHG
jgi:uncharacterized protein YbaR (Trm112 family)